MEALIAVRKYCDEILDGQELAGECMRLAAARTIGELDGIGPTWWDGEELERIAAFVSTLKLHKFGGIPAMLHPWQLHLVGLYSLGKATTAYSPPNICASRSARGMPSRRRPP